MHDMLHIRNARIWTADPARPWAESITIRDGRIAVLDGPAEGHVLNAQGRVLTPGLIDSHLHLLQGGEALSELDLSHVESRSEFESAIAKRHAELPPHQW